MIPILALLPVLAQTAPAPQFTYTGQFAYREVSTTRYDCATKEQKQTTSTSTELHDVLADYSCGPQSLNAQIRITSSASLPGGTRHQSGDVATVRIPDAVVLTVERRLFADSPQSNSCAEQRLVLTCRTQALDVVAESGFDVLAKVETTISFPTLPGLHTLIHVRIVTYFRFSRRPDSSLEINRPVIIPRRTLPSSGTRLLRPDISVAAEVCSTVIGLLTLGFFDQDGAFLAGDYKKYRIENVPENDSKCIPAEANVSVPEWVTTVELRAFVHHVRADGSPDFVLGWLPLAQYAFDELPADADLAISNIEVVQVTQEPGETEPYSVPLVPGKNTAVRVYVRSLSESAKPLAGIEGTLTSPDFSGIELRAENAIRVIARPDIPDPNDDTGSLNFRLPREWTLKEKLTLRADVKLSGANEVRLGNNQQTVTAAFVRPTGYLSIIALPICFSFECQVSGSPDRELRHAAKLLPIPQDHIEYWETPGVNVSARRLGSTTEDRVLKLSALLYRALAQIRAKGVTATIQRRPPDVLFAWLPDLMIGGETSDNFFHGAPSYDAPVWFDWRSANVSDASQVNQRRLAHGLAHVFGLKGLASGRIGKTGFDSHELLAVPSAEPELMTREADQFSIGWLSPQSYRSLYNSPVFTNLRTSAKLPPGRSAETGGFWVITGGANSTAATGSLDPVVRLESVARVTAHDPGGPFCLDLHGATGTLSTHCFRPQFAVEGREEEVFGVTIPAVPDTTRIALRRGTQELAALESGGTITLDIQQPTAGQQWTGTKKVQWTASDSKGRTLQFSVEHSSDDGATWLPILLDGDETSLEVDSGRLPGGKRAHIRVVASAGLDSISKTVGPFEILQSPKITIDPVRLDFANLAAGQSETREVTITNTGTGPLTVDIQPIGGSAFVVEGQSNLTVPAGSATTVRVMFHPTAIGPQQATLKLVTNDSERGSLSIPLNATSFDKLVPNLSIDASVLDFGDVNVGRGKAGAILLTNSGSAPLRIRSVASNSGRFQLDMPLTALTLLPDRSVTAPVRFVPNVGGAVEGELSVTSDDPTRARLGVRLKGNGIAGSGNGPQVTSSVQDLDFASVTVYQSKELLFTFRNSGDRPLRVTSITATTDFHPKPSFAFTVSPNSECSFKVVFQPQRAGPAFGTLTLTSDDPSAPEMRISLRGVGI